ncbi:MAG TPA: hypothetical protein VL442_13725 [Mucilaginibacter sp.]|jgi:hypothetical protein|nr:hypothetical protein [Mucilaginibacter sp.]
MAKLNKLIAIVFLSTVLLIRVSPIYWQAQYLPSFSSGTSFLTLKSFKTHPDENYMVRVEKGIIDANKIQSIPKIKFSGLLILALFGPLLIYIPRHKSRDTFKFLLSTPPRYILQAALRL